MCSVMILFSKQRIYIQKEASISREVLENMLFNVVSNYVETGVFSLTNSQNNSAITYNFIGSYKKEGSTYQNIYGQNIFVSEGLEYLAGDYLDNELILDIDFSKVFVMTTNNQIKVYRTIIPPAVESARFTRSRNEVREGEKRADKSDEEEE